MDVHHIFIFIGVPGTRHETVLLMGHRHVKVPKPKHILQHCDGGLHEICNDAHLGIYGSHRLLCNGELKLFIR